MPKLTQELSGPLRQMQDMAKQIAKVSKEAKIEIDEEKYISKFKPFMMDVVFEVRNYTEKIIYEQKEVSKN